MPEKPFQEKVYNNWFLVILVHLHQFTTYVLFRSCLMGGGGGLQKTDRNKERREGNKTIKDPGTPFPPPFGDKIYNEQSLTDPVFPLPQSERRKLALKIMSMDTHLYISFIVIFKFTIHWFFFNLGPKGSSDALAWRGTVNIAFREFQIHVWCDYRKRKTSQQLVVRS